MAKKLSWKRNKSENDSAYRSLKTYFELGSNRSLKEVATVLRMKLADVKYLATKYNWDVRAAKYDMDHMSKADIRRAKRQGEIIERAEALQHKFLDRAEEIMKLPVIKQRTTKKDDDGRTIAIVIEPMKSPRDAVTFVKETLKIGQMISALRDGDNFNESLLDDNTGVSKKKKTKTAKKAKVKK